MALIVPYIELTFVDVKRLQEGGAVQRKVYWIFMSFTNLSTFASIFLIFFPAGLPNWSTLAVDARRFDMLPSAGYNLRINDKETCD